ncbi:hypothetical protein CN168_06660 [Sinorhizobium medicae]|nr:hypothetical protein CN168_06660 [Sinorhizobium medicae]
MIRQELSWTCTIKVVRKWPPSRDGRTLCDRRKQATVDRWYASVEHHERPRDGNGAHGDHPTIIICERNPPELFVPGPGDYFIFVGIPAIAASCLTASEPHKLRKPT